MSGLIGEVILKLGVIKMSIKIVEYYIRQVLSEGIQRLRTSPELIDEVFAELAQSPLDKTFGDKIIDEIKCFFVDNDIPVRSAFSQNQIELPSITVHLLSSQEDPQYKAMQDHIGYERTPKQPSVIQGPLYALSYDSTNGRLTFPKTTNMLAFRQGSKLFSVEDDEVYTVEGTIKVNESGTPVYQLEDQYLTLVDVDGEIPTRVKFARLYLLSSIDFTINRVAGSWFKEVFEIRVNAHTNNDQAIWLYYIASYILFSSKMYFEEVGLESQGVGASEFRRDTQKMPNNIWDRTIRITFLVQHTWNEAVDVLELEDINVNVESSVTGQITTLEY